MTDRAEVPVNLSTLHAAARRVRWENELAAQMKRAGLPSVRREFYFAQHLGRDFRLDFAWPDRKLAVEVQGGGWMKADKDGNRRGAHGGGAALERDCEKLSLAASLGWRVLQVTPGQIKACRALTWIELALSAGAEGWVQRARRAWALPGSPQAWGQETPR